MACSCPADHGWSIRFGSAVQEHVATVETRTNETKGEHQKSANNLFQVADVKVIP